MFGSLTSFFKQSKEKGTESKEEKSYSKSRTDELKRLFENFVDDFFGGTGRGISYEQALNSASANLQRNLKGSIIGYEQEVAAPRKQMFGETGGLLNSLISDVNKQRQPINIGLGGENLMSFTPYSNMLSNLINQKSGLQNEYLTGTAGDIGQLQQLKDAMVQAQLLPKDTLMEFYKTFTLPQELSRLGTTGQTIMSGDTSKRGTYYGAQATGGGSFGGGSTNVG